MASPAWRSSIPPSACSGTPTGGGGSPIPTGRSSVRRGGYQAVTIEEIAATAGVSPNTVYSYFGGKADLFVAVIRRSPK